MLAPPDRRGHRWTTPREPDASAKAAAHLVRHWKGIARYLKAVGVERLCHQRRLSDGSK